MMTIPDCNAWLIEFIGKNWMPLLLVYSTIRTMFPDSKVLKSIGAAFAGMFPVFGKKDDVHG